MNMDFNINDCLHIVNPLDERSYMTEQERQNELNTYKREAKKIQLNLDRIDISSLE